MILDPNHVQRQASDPQASVWVAANAGTGKTKVLTDRVLSLMVTGTAPQRILCLTFTKAAAAEMANRIADKLGSWSVMSDADLRETLQDLLVRDPSTAEFTRARQLFARVLDTPGGMQIQTIHSFCQSLLRRFPLEAGLAPHFQVMDERAAQEMLQQAQDQMMRAARFSRAPDLYEALQVVTYHVHETKFPELLTSLTYARGKIRRLLDHYGGVRAYMVHLATRMGMAVADTPEKIIDKACEAESYDALGLRYATEALLAGTATDIKRAEGLARWLSGTHEERVAGFEAYQSLFLTGTGEIRKTLITKGAATKSAGAIDVLTGEAARMLRAAAAVKTATTLQATQAVLRLGKTILDNYETLKQQNALLDYDDLILKSRDLLTQDHVSWVLYKLDGGIDHILVDEAQDTNPDQWQVIAALAEEFFTGLGTRDETITRTVFAVGDVKQSIYSFQGADPAAFETMKKRFASHVPAAGKTWREVPMTVSFRSTRAILQAVDAIFSDPSVAQGVEVDDVIRHDAWRSQDGGLVEVWPPLTPTAADPAPAWKPPVERIRADSPRARLATLIAKRIQHMLDRQEILASKGRPIEPIDVMVLVRRRGGFVEELVRALKERNVPVAGVDRMVLSDQMAVMDLMALGRFLLQPDDDLQLACVLKGPLIGLTEEDLFDLAHDRTVPLWSVLRDRAKADLRFHPAHQFLQDLMARTDYVRPFELFTYILSAQEGRKKIVGRLGVEALDPLDEFLELALSYEQSHTPSLEGFLAWMDHNETDIKRDLEQASQNAVRVMTVHGAKGLQAPIVFMPDTLQVPKASATLLWPQDPESGQEMILWPPKASFVEDIAAAEKDRLAQKQDEEYRRLLYVALTRAEDRLYVCGWEMQQKPPAHCWYHLIAQGLSGVAEESEDDFLAAQEETDNAKVLRLESPQLRSVEPQAAMDPHTLSLQPLPAWATSRPEAEPTPPRPLTPSRPLEEDVPTRSPLGEDHGYRFKRGNIIHALLQSLPNLPLEDQESAARLYLANPSHDLKDAQQEDLAQEVMKVLRDDQFADVFRADSQAEVPIVGLVQGQVISAQVDRLLVRPQEVIVIDYKTNRPPPRSVRKVPPLYIQQMRGYHAALKAIYPEHQVRCVLLWTDTPKLMEIPQELLDS